MHSLSCLLFKFLKNVYLFFERERERESERERERQSVSGGRGEREGDIASEAGSRL